MEQNYVVHKTGFAANSGYAFNETTLSLSMNCFCSLVPLC